MLALASPAAAATFGPATPIAGFGDEPAQAAIGGAALMSGGTSAIAGISDNDGNRRAAVAFVSATSPPAAAHGFGPAGAFDLAMGANASGDVALTFTVSDAFGATAAVADGGRALVTWASASDPVAPTISGVFATVAEASGAFGPPQLLADAPTATLPQPTAGAITPRAALVAWVGPQGGEVTTP
jgi:hypothetical protein